MRMDCPSCYGSGGGEGYYRCPSCRGSGSVYVNGDNYSLCDYCEEVCHNDDIITLEDDDKIVCCTECEAEHHPACPECECHYTELTPSGYCSAECLVFALEQGFHLAKVADPNKPKILAA